MKTKRKMNAEELANYRIFRESRKFAREKSSNTTDKNVSLKRKRKSVE